MIHGHFHTNPKDPDTLPDDLCQAAEAAAWAAASAAAVAPKAAMRSLEAAMYDSLSLSFSLTSTVCIYGIDWNCNMCILCFYKYGMAIDNIQSPSVHMASSQTAASVWIRWPCAGTHNSSQVHFLEQSMRAVEALHRPELEGSCSLIGHHVKFKKEQHTLIRSIFRQYKCHVKHVRYSLILQDILNHLAHVVFVSCCSQHSCIFWERIACRFARKSLCRFNMIHCDTVNRASSNAGELTAVL